MAAGTATRTSTAARGEAVRVPQADGTLVALESKPDNALLLSLVTLTDVMSTGLHAALAARVGPGKTVAVVGEGAVGLCGVIASKRLGAERVILLGRHRERTALGREFGADEVVEEHGEEAVERVRDLTDGFGAPVRARVRRGRAVDRDRPRARPPGRRRRPGRGSAAGDVPRQRRVPEERFRQRGPAPARAYIEELLPDVLKGRIQPGRVFDRTTDLDGVPDGYRAMNDREALKVLIDPA
jgi:threonine dehydrogenase-like Zn-dependent dehydrogenase